MGRYLSESSSQPEMMVKSMIGPFHVKCPPIKRQMVHGHLVPTLKNAFTMFSKKRRLTVEVHSPNMPSSSLGDSGNEEKDSSSRLSDQDRVVFRVFKLSRDDDDDSDDESAGTNATVSDEIVDEDGKTWKEQRKYMSDAVVLQKVHKNVIEMRLGSGNETIVRDFRFDDHGAATKFEEALIHIKTLAQNRSKHQIQQYKTENSTDVLQSPQEVAGDVEAPADQSLEILVEIVSATDLPIADIRSTDAFVVVRMKGQEIHRTDVISSNLSPIWTLETGSLFILKMALEEFFSSTSGMVFQLEDYDTVGRNDFLGSVAVPVDILVEGTGERMDFPIVLDKGMVKKVKPGKQPKLNLRFKRASKSDVDFMRAFQEKNQRYGAYGNETFLPLGKPDSSFMKRQTKRVGSDTLHRIKPYPNPESPEDTKWLTEARIDGECMKPSSNWVEAGSGGIGKVYVEVLKCDGLPNMDSSSLTLTDKTDAFACLIFEDVVVNTDVIGNTLSPRWMPWCNRAFCFNIADPSSNLFLGIFDFDPELSPVQLLAKGVNSEVHDSIGRIVVNLTNFRPGTTYVLHYNLFHGELLEHRNETRGTVTLRLRITHNDSPRRALLKGLELPVQNVVSVKRKLDYEVARYVANGVVDDLQFSLNTITRYIDELYTYEAILEQVNKAIMTIVLWRGHRKIIVRGKTFMLPLHSITAFIWLNLVAWNYDRFPAFFAFCIAWLLLACNEAASQHPSRWHKRPKYRVMMNRLVCGKSLREEVEANQNLQAIKDYEGRLAAKTKRREDERKKAEAQEEELQVDLGAELAKAEKAEQLDNNHGFGVHLNILKPHLYPIQKELRKLIYTLRAAKGIVLWSEACYSFWLVTISLAVSALFFFIPWSFFIKWFLRVAAFLGFGPWMWCVDKYILKTNPYMTDEEQDEAFRQRLVARYNEVRKEAGNLFLREEAAQKIKSIKRYMFGRHLLSIPLFREDLYEDFPLPSSHCYPMDHDFSVVPKLRKYGQALKGDMIPMREVQVAHNPIEDKQHKGFLRGLLSRKKNSTENAEKDPLMGAVFRPESNIADGNAKED